MDTHDTRATQSGDEVRQPGTPRVFLFTDLVDSTGLKQRLGDTAAAALISRHNELVRGCLAARGGTEIDNAGDGFFATFHPASEAVLCALDIQWRLAHLEAAERPQVRVGIHLGEAQLVAAQAQGLPAKPVGLAVDAAARIMGLAQGKQILLTRSAFDAARQHVVNGPFDTTVVWLAHGSYRLAGIDEPVEVCEAGVEGLSPLHPPPNSPKAIRDVSPADEDTLGWRPAVGHEVPGHPGWVLQRRLGEGGFGEIWLARDAQSGGLRALKFCFAPDRLRTLKRELALIRLMREALGDRPDIVHIHDVHLNAPPYFLELDYSAGGDLYTWADAHGGIGALPMGQRLSIVGQAATALAAAHSVGVIHKDVKPGNILIDEAEGGVQVRLTDFGIGQLVRSQPVAENVPPQSELDSLALTELSSRTGTRLYMAPELMAGRTPSIQSDIYSLGVLLYQVLSGDLQRPLGQGWERDVDDELLREDIRACVDHSPERRLAGAGALAERLAGLKDRRRRLQAERDARLAAERARQRRRLLAWLLAAVTVIAAGATVIAVRERHRASREARLRAGAVRAAETMARELARGIKPIAGTRLQTVEGVLAAAATVYDDLLRDSPTTDVLAGKAAMMNDFADIYIQANSTTKAAASADEAARIWTGLHRDMPSDPDALRGLVAAKLRQSRIAELRGNTGASLRAARDALALTDTSTTQVVFARGLAAELADALERTCSMEWARGNPDEPANLHDRALRLRKDIARGPRGDANATRSLALLYRSIGEIHSRAMPHRSQALYSYALELLTGMAQAAPDNADWQLDITRLRTLQAEISLRRDDMQTTELRRTVADAERELRAAWTVSRRFATLDPANLDWQRQLVNTEWLLSDLPGRESLASDVQRQLSATLELRDRVRARAQADPHNVMLQDEAASLNCTAARAMTLLGREGNAAGGNLAHARALLVEALDAWQRLAGMDPDAVRWRDRLQDGCSALAAVALADGDTTACEAARTRALATGYDSYRRLATRFPRDDAYQERLALHLKQASANDAPESVVGMSRAQAARTAVDILQRLSDSHADQPHYRDELAEAHRIAAWASWDAVGRTSGTARLDRLAEARKSCESADALYRGLVETGSADPRIRASAAEALRMLADILREQGETTGARAALDTARQFQPDDADAPTPRTLPEPSTSRMSRARLNRADIMAYARNEMLASLSICHDDPSVSNATAATEATLRYARLHDADSAPSRAAARKALEQGIRLLDEMNAQDRQATGVVRLRTEIARELAKIGR